jgi:hypothetical protein
MIGHHWTPGIDFFVTLLGEIRQAKPCSLFLVVCPDQALAITAAAAASYTETVCVAATAQGPTSLHAHTSLDARYHIGADNVAGAAASRQLSAIRIGPAEVEKIDAGEGDEEAADK